MIEVVDTILKIILAILALFGGKELVRKVVFYFSKKEQNSYVAGSSGETIGRDKVVINHNYFNGLGVGDSEKLLSGSAISQSISPETKKLDWVSNSLGSLVAIDKTFAVTADDVMLITKFFQSVFDADSSNGRNSQSLTKGAFFALISETNNPEWREHCASSLREFFHAWDGVSGKISTAFNGIKKSSDGDFPTMTTNENEYKRMNLYYQYFSAKCHHNQVGACKALKQLHSDEELKDDTPQLFKKTVAMFLTEMINFVKLTKYESA